MKNFFKTISAISTVLVAVYSILKIVERLKNRQPDVIYFDTKDDEE